MIAQVYAAISGTEAAIGQALAVGLIGVPLVLLAVVWLVLKLDEWGLLP